MKIFFLNVILFFVVLLTTDLGLLISMKCIPGEITAEKISGSLLSGWKAKNIKFKNASLSFKAEIFNFKWEWEGLLKKKFNINVIDLENASIKYTTNSKQESKTSLEINIPIDIHLNQLHMKNIDVDIDQRKIFFKKINASAELAKKTLTLNYFSILTHDFSTMSHGKINFNEWSIDFYNKFTALSYGATPSVFTQIKSTGSSIFLKMQSASWLTIEALLKNNKHELTTMEINAHWTINTKNTSILALEKINGFFQSQGKIYGTLINPIVSMTLNAKNINTEEIKLEKAKAKLEINQDKKINFNFQGENFSFGKTFFEKMSASILGGLNKHMINIDFFRFQKKIFSFISEGSYLNNAYALDNGFCYIDLLNIHLHPLKLNIDFKNKNKVLYQMQLWQEQEKLSLQGETLINLSGPTTHILIASQKFTIINTQEYKAIIQPELNFYNDALLTKLSGVLKILNANIAPLDFSQTATVSEDIIYINDNNIPTHKKPKPSPFSLDLLLNIQALNLNYKGLKASIAGETRIIQLPYADLNASGQLKILNGSYQAYGQTLVIEPGGSINFNHNIQNPLLNIKASKEITASPEGLNLPSYQRYLIVGLNITGSANEPRIKFFSSPPGINQQDILSYLLFGYPQSQLTNSQSNVLWSAFNMINNDQGDYNLSSLQKSIQKEFGLSEFGFSNTSEYNASTQQYQSGTAFAVGKRITDNLTATYNVGLLVPINVLYLRYRLSPNWSLQSDSSSLGYGGDIFYTIQRN